MDFRLLSKGDTEEIHGASLEVLMKTGVMVKNDAALKLLKDAGCAIEGNIVSGPGMQASENCQSLAKLVLDNEHCGAAYRLVRGITVDEVSLATDVIVKVEPGGHFPAERHTRENLRKERFIPSDVLDRLSPDAWVKAGSRDTTSRARETANKILDEHEPDPLPKEAAQALKETLGGILERHGISLSSLPAI